MTRPKPPTARQRCWTALRILVRATAREVAACARVNIETARRFIRELRSREIIKRANPRTHPTTATPAVFRLVKDLGPFQPLRGAR